MSFTLASGKKPYTASNREIYSWAIGGIALNALICTYGQAMNIFTVGFGIDASVIGWAMMLPRVIDALIDPFMGHLSDNTQTRWGRRKPFLVIGAVLAAFFLYALWWGNRAWSNQMQLVFITLLGTIFYTSWGLYSMAWTALGYELTDDYQERSRIAAITGYFTTVVLLFNGWVYWFALRPLFRNGVLATISDLFSKGFDWPHMSAVLHGAFATVKGAPTNEINGIRWIAAFIIIISLASAFYAAKNTRERFARSNIKHVSMKVALKATFKNRPFITLMVYKLCQVFGERVFQGLLFYIGIYFVCRGEKNLATQITGIASIFGSFVGFVVLPFVRPISRKLGKKAGLIIPSVIAFTLMVCQPVILNPNHPYLLLIPLLMFAPLSVISNAMISAIVPDICDLDELEHGERREGLFTSVVAFMGKLEISLSVLIVGYLVKFSGINMKIAAQTPESLAKLIWLGVGFGIFFTFCALVTSFYFKMTESMMEEVRLKLEARRIQVAQSEEAPEH